MHHRNSTEYVVLQSLIISVGNCRNEEDISLLFVVNNNFSINSDKVTFRH